MFKALPPAAAGALFAASVMQAPALAQTQPLPAVVAAAATMAEAGREASFTGRIVALQRVDLRARVPGFLESKEFNEGDRVSEGDVLFKIESDAYAAAVQEIEGSIKAAEATLRLAEIERTRQEELVSRGTTAQRSLDIATAQLGESQGNLLKLQGTLQRAQLDLSYTNIVAPFDGIVGLTKWDVGAFVGPESCPLVTIVRTDPMNVEFPIASALVFRLTGNTENARATDEVKALIRLPDGEIYEHPGDINLVDVEVNQSTDTITVRAEFPNPEGDLVHGALVNVLLSDARPSLALTVPQQAVQRDMQGSFVLLVDDESKAQVRRVVVERYSQGRAVIEEGLEEGDVVIVEGVNKARPGMEVDAAPAALPDSPMSERADESSKSDSPAESMMDDATERQDGEPSAEDPASEDKNGG